MGLPAARMGDMVIQSIPHCHAPIHPPAPVPTPVPHPGMPLAIIKGEFTVLIGSMPAARVMDTTIPCMMIPCVPGGPGMITLGSFTCLIGNMPAARITDMTAHSACVAPIPGPVGQILPPGCPTVLIG
ncbi:MAG: PAAR domain-containing protein [Alphaproteobacteria bacterium]